MNVAVLGATGRTGRPMVEELLRRDHAVVALVRDPAKLDGLRDRVQVVTGTSTDRPALDHLLTGADAVLSALGPSSRETTLHTDTARTLVEAMPAHGVTRFVGVSGAGIDAAGDQKGARDKAISWLVKRLGGAVAADKQNEYAVFADSDLDWTLVRPPRLVDGPPTREVYHDAHTPGRSSSLRRSDLAIVLVDILDQHLYSQQSAFVAQK